MSRDDLAEWVGKIRNHPQFQDGAHRYVVEYAQLRERLGPLNKVVANFARIRIIENLTYLHYVAIADQGGPGATFERLAEFSNATDDIGARAVRSVLRLAQISGFVVAGRNADDGRLRIYTPTPALVAFSREYMVVTLRPLDAVLPELRICERLATDLNFYNASLAAMGRGYLAFRNQIMPRYERFQKVARLEGAASIFAVGIDCLWSDRNLPSAPELSRRFYVSQSQVRAVLRAAEAAELISTAPRGRLVAAQALADAFFDLQCQFLAYCAVRIFNGPTAQI